MRTAFIFFLMLGLWQLSNGQNASLSAENQTKSAWSVGAYGGLSQFYGDLREYKLWPIEARNFDSQPERGTWHGGIMLKRSLSPIVGLRADVGMGTLNGTKRRVYFSYFRADYQQATVSATLNLVRLWSGTSALSRWNAELYGGIGLVRFRATAYQLGTGKILRRTDIPTSLGMAPTPTYLTVSARQFSNAAALPLGISMTYRISPCIHVMADLQMNFLNTDLLDATLPATGPNKRDRYAWGVLGLAYQWKK
mgnify:CR=1 FL=1